ncbi:MAG: hypothetical protein K8T10_12015 [Candidatus Eremiobacteraeota bacterium]|nr:hypothetical protein [Candidatus Eremiobacteraeota bacterium]
MEFKYKKSLILAYMGFGAFLIAIVLFSIPFVVVFQFVIVFDLLAILLAIGAFKKTYEIFNITILIERDGIHFFRGRRKTTILPWESVDDFSFTGSRCILRVGRKFFYISRELEDFEEFENLMVDQLTMTIEQRGSNLPKLDRPESMGGVREEEAEILQKPLFQPRLQDISQDEEEDAPPEMLGALEPPATEPVSNETLSSISGQAEFDDKIEWDDDVMPPPPPPPKQTKKYADNEILYHDDDKIPDEEVF